jgi:hypothetical protein
MSVSGKNRGGHSCTASWFCDGFALGANVQSKAAAAL